MHDTQALFWSKAQELATELEAQGRMVTIAGVERACMADRAARPLTDSHAHQVLRLMQLFCEGHNRDMQVRAVIACVTLSSVRAVLLVCE